MGKSTGNHAVLYWILDVGPQRSANRITTALSRIYDISRVACCSTHPADGFYMFRYSPAPIWTVRALRPHFGDGNLGPAIMPLGNSIHISFHIAKSGCRGDFAMDSMTLWISKSYIESLYVQRICIAHWPSQEPKLEVPTIYKAYIRPI